MGRKNLSLDDDVAAVDGFPGRVDGGRQDLAPVDHLDERHAPARGIQHLDIETSFKNPMIPKDLFRRNPILNVHEACTQSG